MLSVEIIIEGKIDNQWAEWLGEMQIEHIKKQSILMGVVDDQAALYGLISKLRDLGLSLRSVNTREIS